MAEFRESPEFAVGIEYSRARYARAVAAAIQQDMEDLCPVDTSALVSSITSEAVGATVYISVGGGEVDYALFVEYGTSMMRAQPFIRPALYRRRDAVDLS